MYVSRNSFHSVRVGSGEERYGELMPIGDERGVFGCKLETRFSWACSEDEAKAARYKGLEVSVNRQSLDRPSMSRASRVR